jgi:hypothetical protein
MVGPYHYVVNNIIDTPRADITPLAPKGLPSPVTPTFMKPTTPTPTASTLPTTTGNTGL